MRRQWKKGDDYQLSVYAALLNAGLQRGFKPPHGEVWTVDMLRGDYKAPAHQGNDWRKDREGLLATAQKIKAQAQAFTPEGRAAKRQAVQNLRTVAERRKRAEEMKREGADPKRIRDYLKTGV